MFKMEFKELEFPTIDESELKILVDKYNGVKIIKGYQGEHTEDTGFSPYGLLDTFSEEYLKDRAEILKKKKVLNSGDIIRTFRKVGFIYDNDYTLRLQKNEHTLEVVIKPTNICISNCSHIYF
jgi:hypothetical protein